MALIAWSKGYIIAERICGDAQNGGVYAVVAELPSIPYPTVEALLCWWIVGMLAMVFEMIKTMIVDGCYWKFSGSIFGCLLGFLVVPFLAVPVMAFDWCYNR